MGALGGLGQPLDGWLVVFRKSWRKGPSNTGRRVGIFISSSELVH